MTPLKCKKHGTISPSGMHFFLFFSFLSRSEHFCEFIEPYNNSLMPRVPYWWSQSPSNWKPYQSPRGRCASISFGWDFFWPASTVLTMMVDVWDFEASLVLFVVLFLCVLLLVLWLVSLLVCWFCSCSCSCCCCCCFCCWLLVVIAGCWLLIADCWLLIVVVLCIAHYEMHIHHSRGMCCIMLLGSQRPREVLFGHIGRQTDVSWNMGTPKSSILIELSIINHPAIGVPTLMETTQIDAYRNKDLTKLDFWLVSSSKMFAMLLRQQASKQCSCLKSGSQYTTLRWAVGLAN